MAEVNYRRGDSDERPWGRWEVLDVGDGFAVKRLTVKPGAILSLQLHYHREEHWIVGRGDRPQGPAPDRGGDGPAAPRPSRGGRARPLPEPRAGRGLRTGRGRGV